jgi:hypothetical protein
MDEGGFTFSDLSQQLYQIGRGKHEVTIRTWLNPESRIVGPRDSDSFYSIALITNDKELLEDPDTFCHACKEIRSLRIKILKFLGKLIMHSIAGGQAESGFEETLFSIAGDVSQMAKVLQVEAIEDVSLLVPVYVSNRLQRTE